MDRLLEEVKTSLVRRYLGRAGIHGIGLDPSRNVIIVYIDFNQERNLELTELLEKIATEASPWSVVQKFEDAPRFQ